VQPEQAAAALDLAEQLPASCRRLLDFQDAAVPDLDLSRILEEDPWLPACLAAGVVSVAAALHERAPAPALLQALQDQALRRCSLAANAASEPHRDAGAAAALRAEGLTATAALAACATACIDALPGGPQGAQAAAALLERVARRPTVDGWLGGTAALGWARVAGALLDRGLAPGSEGSAAEAAGDETAAAAAAARIVEALSALASGRASGAEEGGSGGGDGGGGGGHRGPASWALRCGAAAGLAVLLGADVQAGAFGAGLSAGELGDGQGLLLRGSVGSIAGASGGGLLAITPCWSRLYSSSPWHPVYYVEVGA
jgi:hypothetical protein